MKKIMIVTMASIVLAFGALSCSNNNKAEEAYYTIMQKMENSYGHTLSSSAEHMQSVLDEAETFEQEYGKDLSEEKLNDFLELKNRYKESLDFQIRMEDLLRIE